jgi:hypothetical protein
MRDNMCLSGGSRQNKVKDEKGKINYCKEGQRKIPRKIMII